MANTVVKNVGSLFANQTVSAAAKGTAGNGEFHKVWNSQMNKDVSGSTISGSNKQKLDGISGKGKAGIQEKAAVQKDESVKPEESQSVKDGGEEISASAGAQEQEEAASGVDDAAGMEKASEVNNAAETEEKAGTEEPGTDAEEVINAAEFEIGADELQDALKGQELQGQKGKVPVIGKADTTERDAGVTQEQLRAMEVLGAAAVQLMEQIANVFGITTEELKSVMDSMEMGQADLLDPSRLRNLFLELGGAGDIYALITDGNLYDSYRMIMRQLNQVLHESAIELEEEPDQLQTLFRDSLEALQDTKVPMLIPENRMEGVQERAVLMTGESTSPNSGMSAEAVQDGQEAPKQDTGAQERNERQSESRANGDNQVNLFTQNFRSEQFRPELQQLQEISQDSPWSADTREIMDQILDYMKFNMNADTTSLEMQLHPESLGTLHIQIASRGGIVTANFITENEAVKVAVESQMLQLREQLEAQGVKVEAIEVTVQTHEFEQNLEQGRGRSQQEGEKRSRGRRFRMDGVAAMGVMETDDAAEAERMASGESTVSYTA
ncbi:MAG TPA: hypothetical protein DCZ91_19605 [Lachnospiraceae bacterium]|nr:hypothetical protein [Lachnospiraceae bacterium]